jgi:hypothetical protein
MKKNSIHDNKEISEKFKKQIVVSEEKIKNFKEILDNIDDLDPKNRALWREIYENAAYDRECASILLTNAMLAMEQNSHSHVALGTTLSKYLERMNKSNDQILKLAEMVLSIKEKEGNLNEDELYDRMQS